MRSRVLLPEGRKVFFVLDQFEQWLHAHHDQDAGSCELIRALRQCDGDNVQCLILVRDDFAMAAARFMRALEIRLVESDNFATVDPFDLVQRARSCGNLVWPMTGCTISSRGHLTGSSTRQWPSWLKTARSLRSGWRFLHR